MNKFKLQLDLFVPIIEVIRDEMNETITFICRAGATGLTKEYESIPEFNYIDTETMLTIGELMQDEIDQLIRMN